MNLKLNRAIFIVACFILCLQISLNAQQISFSFTANHACEYTQLDSVLIENTTLGCDTTLYWNDTVISFSFTGMSDVMSLQNASFVAECAPNPFDLEANIYLEVIKPDNFIFEIFDIAGRKLLVSTIHLNQGTHIFTLIAGSSFQYIINVGSSNHHQCLHLIQTNHQANKVSLVYMGLVNGYNRNNKKKSGKAWFNYCIGNELRFTGFAQGTAEEITDIPSESMYYTFNIDGEIPETPQQGAIISGLDQISWNWFPVAGASRYTWSTSCEFETSNDIGTDTSLTLEGLYCGTEYTIYIWAYNACGSSEALMLTQETLFSCGCTFADNRDANTYQTVQIGSQCWMAENMAYLPLVHTDAEFQSLGSWIQRAYGVYGYNGSDVELAKAHENYATYGVIYNWWAAMDGYVGSSTNPSGLQGICPKGWHVPSDDEWKQLEGEVDATYPYGDPEWDLEWFRGDDAGSALAGNAPLWTDDNLINHSSFNSSGFNILPGGQRDQWGNSIAMGGHTYLWSATEDSQPSSWVRAIYYDDPSVYRNPVNKQWGFYVRCVRN
ncbi:MAG TPA: FISUMP domain-containing protein [Bacteroidales bacterium]|nr:FISUMP domain-containing protein [Bacteroidales bacterium]HQP04509.1 FISUMP domain-containing protein [Bacteroidales bacterium]